MPKARSTRQRILQKGIDKASTAALGAAAEAKTVQRCAGQAKAAALEGDMESATS
jgi:hypothetical protein